MNSCIFYVYVHRRKTDGSVFYVGKGKGNRAFSIGKRNRYWRHIFDKHGFMAEIVVRNMAESDAFQLERELISFYGRNNLANLTDGGDGPAGAMHSESANIKKSYIVKNIWDVSTDRKKSMSERVKSLWASKDRRDKQISAMKTAQSDPVEIARKKASMRLACAKPVMCIDTGERFDTVAYAVDWLRSTGFAKAAGCSISFCCSGKRTIAYGYKWAYV